MSEFTVLHADYHRNGVGGEGFYVGLIYDDAQQCALLVTWFPEYQEDDDTLAKFQTRISVIDPAKAAEGNVYMHPFNGQPGGNAWRGDHYQDAAKAIRAAVEARWAL